MSISLPSLGQERLWFLHQVDPTDASFNLHVAQRIRGPLQVASVRRALQTIVERHEALRSRFPAVDGLPSLAIEADTDTPLELLDVSGLPSGEREAAACELLAPRVNATFDLANGPLFRFSLVRLADDDHILCPVIHHAVFDGWSENIWTSELAVLLDGGTLPSLSATFRDHANRERAAALDDEPAMEYWRQQLRDVPTLALPTDRRCAEIEASHCDMLQVELQPELVARLERLARSHRCTLYMVLLAAYEVLLGQHSSQDDFCVATPISARDSADLSHVIGYFTNTLILRANLTGDPTFNELLRRVRGTALAAYGHPRVPFEQLMSDLGATGGLTRTALFQTMFALHTERGMVQRAVDGALAFSAFDAGLRQTRFELEAAVWPIDDGLHLEFLFNTDVFDRATVSAIAQRFEALLVAVAADPEARLSALPALTAADSTSLAAWREGPTSAVTEPVLSNIPATADTAVLCGAESVTYTELARRSDELAGALIESGVNVGDLVGICLPRTPAVVVAMLAIWKAGAAYVPIDPSYPESRVAYLIADSGLKVTIADSGFPGPTVSPDAAGSAQPRTPSLDALAYVIYTSGSTGQPKGVGITHRALSSRVAWMREAYGLVEPDVVAQFASISFDTHAEEIFPCLTAGAVLALLPDGAASLPDFLRAAPGSTVTVLDLPTAYWHELVEAGASIRWPEGLRLVIIGGEQVDSGLVVRWTQEHPDVRLVNTYGPTETTIIATATDLRAETGVAPIGRPIADTLVEVRSPAGTLIPPGAIGELWIGGVGVAPGYLGRPELTRERFVDGWYGTGDLVRWRHDGQLEFVGRRDHQVKIRGHRVEPGEVEFQLRRIDDVEQAFVTAAAQSLVAYVVCAQEALADVIEQCRAALPQYLVPDTYVRLDRLPLNTNGKVDLSALPLPVRALAPDRSVPPRTDAETLVAEVWQDVLAVESLGVGDNFFDLGGHSLLATRASARLSAMIDLTLPIALIFVNRTVESYAAAIESALMDEIDELSDAEAQALLLTEGPLHR